MLRIHLKSLVSELRHYFYGPEVVCVRRVRMVEILGHGGRSVGPNHALTPACLWRLANGHGGSTHTTETGRCYESGLHFSFYWLSGLNQVMEKRGVCV